jgi:ABC-type sugar transport system ATPase subunit
MADSFLEMSGISKRFGGVHALNNVSFSLRKGEVQAMIGENGAGKSTLIKVLSGAIKPDEGEVFLEGRQLKLGDPKESMKAGIRTVYQEMSLIPQLDVARNIFLGNEPVLKGAFIDRKSLYEKADSLLSELGIAIDSKCPVGKLSIAERQLVEVAKALSMDAKIIIFDEPTATLSRRETEVLFDLIFSLKNRGISSIFISHRLGEILPIADRVTVLKDGRVVATKDKNELDIPEMIRLMVGRTVKSQFPLHEKTGEIVFSVKGMSRKGLFQDISFDLRRGEVLGIAGLVGSYRTEVLKSIFGAELPDKGEFTLFGKPFSPRSPMDSLRRGVGFVPENRKEEGIILHLPIKNNIVISSLNQVSNLGFLRLKKMTELASRMIKALRISAPGMNAKGEQLSGGNQQKVVMAKWMAANTSILLLDEPTRGIDVGSKAELLRLVHEYAEQGNSVILVSSDLQELFSLSDRILLLQNGRVISIYNREETSQEQVLKILMEGEKH